MSEKVYVYVQAPDGTPLMPTTRCGKVRRLLKDGEAKIVFSIPFTIRLTYEPTTRKTQPVVLGIDPGRTNIGLAAVKNDGICVFRAHVITRNKEVPRLMEKRHFNRDRSRRGERLRRKRRAKKNGTLMKNGAVERFLPGCEKTIKVKDIINTESKFVNRKIPKGRFTPTATHLLRTHINAINKVKKLLPITDVCLEINKFAFMALDNPNVKKKDIDFHHGPLYGYNNLHTAVYEMQHGMCLLCGKTLIEHYHHMLPKSKGGSNTIANVAGLCIKCHDKVHKDEKAKQKLDVLHNSLNKKYGSLNILNQIVPCLTDELSKTFPNHLHVTYGYYTKQTREDLCLVKNHDVDAYCIAVQGLYEDHIKTDSAMPVVHEIAQFRRQNRAKTQCQRERTYKLDGVTVAKNRRKRTEQFTDSLHEWYIKTKQDLGVEEARRLQSKLTIKASKPYKNTMNRILPGAVFYFNGRRYVMRGQSSTNGSYTAFGYGDLRFPIKRCKIVCKNCGLVYVS